METWPYDSRRLFSLDGYLLNPIPKRTLEFVHWPRLAPEPWAGVWPLAWGYKNGIRLTTGDVQDFYCIHLVTAGALRFRLPPGTNVCLHAGDMFGVFPYTRFNYINEFPNGKENGEMYWTRLAGHLVHEYMTAMGMSIERPWCRARNPPDIARRFDELRILVDSEDRTRDIRAVEVLHSMLSAADYSPTPPPATLPLAERVRTFMQNETERGHNIEQIAGIFGVSRSSLFLHFKEAFGLSPVQVLIEARLERARRLLTETDMPVRQIASEAGYGDPLYFSRQFARHTGKSPSAFRAAQRPH